MNWPSPGNDPWYAANSTDNGARRTYYGVNAIPCEVVDGDTFLYRGSQATVTAALLARRDVPSHLWMSLEAYANDAGDSAFLRVRVVADTVIGSGYVLQMAAVENVRTLDSSSSEWNDRFLQSDGKNVSEREWYGIHSFRVLLPIHRRILADSHFVEPVRNRLDTTTSASLPGCKNPRTSKLCNRGTSTSLPI